MPDLLLITLTGADRPGLAASLFAALAELPVELIDVEQVEIHERLLLGILVDPGPAGGAVQARVAAEAAGLGLAVEFAAVGPPPPRRGRGHHHVTVLAPALTAGEFGRVLAVVAGCGANVDQIVCLSRRPVVSYELVVAGGEPDRLRRELTAVAAATGVDIAIERSGLHRRAKRLIVLDVDSTLIQGEVIEMLAEHAGRRDEVARITEEAMRGDLDFEAALRARVALLAGVPAAATDEVARGLVLTPGARTLVRTLRRVGYGIAIVSGGFTQIIEPLAADLGVERATANTLEVAGGVLTGRLVGPIIDRAGKATALERFAADAGVALAQTVAVGDGANDVDMLARAGLGIAFNAKPAARAAADTVLNVPFLDAVLFILGISRQEIEAADEESPANERSPGDEDTG